MPEMPSGLKRETFPASFVTAQDLLSHPRFREAADLHVEVALAACREDRIATHILGNAARQLAFCMIAMLSARSELNTVEPLCTLRRLHQALNPWGLAHHGKIEALIDRLVGLGLLVKHRDDQDRRLVVLTPTEPFHALLDRLTASNAQPGALLVDDPMMAAVAARDRDATRLFRASAMDQVEAGAMALQHVPQMFAVIRHDAGWLVLFALIDAIRREDGPGHTAAAIARQFGVSHPHVGRVFTSGLEFGCLEETSSGVLRLTAAFRQGLDLWIAQLVGSAINSCRIAAATG